MARGRRVPALRTRLHGLRHMCSRRAALPRRALWVLAFCTALGLLLSWSSNRLLHWLSFPSHTQVRTEWSRQLAFPAVTLCNNNPLRFPRLSKGDLYYAGHWLGLLLPNRTARPLLTELLRGDEARLRWFAKLADFRLFLPPRHYEGISADFMDRLGHQLEDMLLSCKYRGELCGPHNFSAVSAPRDPHHPPGPHPFPAGALPGESFIDVRVFIPRFPRFFHTLRVFSHDVRLFPALCVCFFPTVCVFSPPSACFPHGVCVLFPYLIRRGCAVLEGEVWRSPTDTVCWHCSSVGHTLFVGWVGQRFSVLALLKCSVSNTKWQRWPRSSHCRALSSLPSGITTVSLNASHSPPEQS